jgi:hypothetical protein
MASEEMPLCMMLEGHLKSSLTRWVVPVSQLYSLHPLQNNGDVEGEKEFNRDVS